MRSGGTITCCVVLKLLFFAVCPVAWMCVVVVLKMLPPHPPHPPVARSLVQQKLFVLFSPPVEWLSVVLKVLQKRMMTDHFVNRQFYVLLAEDSWLCWQAVSCVVCKRRIILSTGSVMCRVCKRQIILSTGSRSRDYICQQEVVCVSCRRGWRWFVYRQFCMLPVDQDRLYLSTGSCVC